MDTMQRKMALRSFLSSAGFKIFIDELKLFSDSSENRVIKRCKKPISVLRTSSLNFDLGEKSGFEKTLAILKSYENELLDKSSSGT